MNRRNYIQMNKKSESLHDPVADEKKIDRQSLDDQGAALLIVGGYNFTSSWMVQGHCSDRPRDVPGTIVCSMGILYSIL